MTDGVDQHQLLHVLKREVREVLSRQFFVQGRSFADQLRLSSEIRAFLSLLGEEFETQIYAKGRGKSNCSRRRSHLVSTAGLLAGIRMGIKKLLTIACAQPHDAS